MKICLVCPPDRSKREEDFEYCFSSYNIPNLGVAYIASVLEKNGFQVDILECFADNITIKKMFDIFEKEKYDAIGISTYDYNSFNVVKIANYIKKMLPNTFLFFGGYFATLCYELLLTNLKNVDCCVLGEGEYTCLELMQKIQGGEDWKNIYGIAYLNENNIVKTLSRPLIYNLDELPIPKRKFICKKGLASLITSRGCYGNCIFCSIKAFYKYSPGEVIRYRSSTEVVKEIEYLVNELHATYINIYDDNFLVPSPKNRNRIWELVTLIKEKKLNFKFAITVKASDVPNNIDILKALQEVGLECVFVGIESFCERQLKFYNKKTSVEENEESIRVLRQLGLKIDIGFIYIDPFVKLDEIKVNLERIRDIKYFERMYEGSFLISMYRPLGPVFGSPIYDILDEKGMLENNDNGYNFVNEEINIYYKMVKKWLQYIYPINIKYYLAFKARELGEYNKAGNLVKAKINLAYLDVECMLKICNKIMAGYKNIEELENILEEEYIKIKEIDSFFNEEKKELFTIQRSKNMMI